MKASTVTVSSGGYQGQGSEEDDPTLQYVQLKLQQEYMLNNRRNFTAIQFAEIRSLLTELERDFLFDEKEAKTLIQKERDEVLSKKLRGSENTPSPAEPLESDVSRSISDNVQVSSSSHLPSSASSDIFEDTNSDISGGLLDLLEDPSAETAPDGSIITLKDMSLPRHWSGKTPKLLLQEVVTRRDRFAVITYALISGHSRAKRVSLNVHWHGTTFEHWSMDDVACVDQTQAEEYIALIALHALTFPHSQGFASHPGGASKLTFFRLLPPSARDLWDQLEDARKLREDSTNRQVWAKLQSIIQPKLDPNSKVRNIEKLDCCPTSDSLYPQVIGKAPKVVHDKKSRVSTNTHSKNVETSSEQLISAYRTLQQSASYQDMLVRGVLVHINLSLTVPLTSIGFSGKPSYRST